MSLIRFVSVILKGRAVSHGLAATIAAKLANPQATSNRRQETDLCATPVVTVFPQPWCLCQVSPPVYLSGFIRTYQAVVLLLVDG